MAGTSRQASQRCFGERGAKHQVSDSGHVSHEQATADGFSSARETGLDGVTV